MSNNKLAGASRVLLPQDELHASVLEFLCQRFTHVSREQWQQRFACGKILDGQGQPLAVEQDYQPGARLYYFRELEREAQVPFKEQLLYEDELLLVVDKPHFLTVSPVGGYVEQTLLRRMQRRYPGLELSPLHRLDRLTAGVMLLCKQPQYRDAYQQLFRLQQVEKVYEAVAAPLPELGFPYTRRSRMQPATDCFFLMREVPGEANSETCIHVIDRGARYWHYRLEPVSGRKHQLRVHMAGLGAPILGDDFYPQLQQRAADDFTRPLQLLARSLAFVDPVTGQERKFCSMRRLQQAGALD